MNYKDIIAGTINSLAEKVREATEGGTVRSIYDRGADRAKGYARLVKLNLEMNGANEELKRVYTEIGRLYYEQAKDAPEGYFASLFSQVAEISSGIIAKQDEIDELKASIGVEEPDIDVEFGDFEDVVNATEDDGKNE